MKNKSLFFQIGILFGGIIIGLCTILALLFPIILREFFTNEVYSTIESSQYNIINIRLFKNLELEYVNDESNDTKVDIRFVTHIQVPKDGINESSNLKITKAINSSELNLAFFKQIIKQGKSQSDLPKRYVKQLGNKKVFYVITKYDNKNKSGFLISYMWDTYRNSLLKALLQELM
ncbi:hypothetical protein K9O30_00435 [Clostridium bowmanii]|uniref:hypothetical protein n=1 Tax=Clostridium bowmanii TaxID=132925 RepID=UPI001C0E7879|nr:hypothetical protein [Clostridium bowmanii]MBU3188057.1 hypothetical protein [Clostridium bowmanii]MCA1072238.1 hypothetical protein [Clostridium bowmanii]